MSRARVTLLSLIKRENQTKDLYDTKTRQMEPFCTLVDKDDMTKIAAFEMIEAAKVICIAVKRWLFKKWRRSRYYVVDIYFDADHDIADKIYIVGDFTLPKWTTQIPMKYSFFHRSFMARVKIHDNSQFKFIVDGTYICCPTYPMTYSPDKFTNNVFKTNKIRHYSESRSFSEFKGSSIGFIKRSEELYRLKNTHILNLIAINNKIDSNLLYESKNNRCSYFSPDVNFGRKVLNHSEYIIPFCNFQNQFSTKNLVRKELTSTMNSTSKLSESDCFKAENFEIKSSIFFSKNPKKTSHIVTQQSSKTPMSLICNPLRANIKREENKSQRDEFSDLSDEDLFFIDDYFRSNTITTEDKIYLTNSNGVICTSPQPQRVEESYHFVANGFKISKSKRPSGDAFFTSKLGLGVADGVGGWQNYGIDSSGFSEKLMDACKNLLMLKEDELDEYEKELGDLCNEDKIEELESNDEAFNSNYCSDMNKAFGVTIRKRKLKRARSSFHLDEKMIKVSNSSSNQIKFELNSPQSDSTCKDRQMIMKNINFEPGCILKEAYQKVDVYGSSTACIATMHNQILKISSLGDSRCLLIRYSSLNHSSQVLLKTEEQQHSFNAPYQLANIPENLKDTKQGVKRDGKNIKFWKDKVSDSILYQCKVKEGDIVLCATDGLFDNLYINEILQIIDSFMTECYECKSFCSTDSMKTSSNTPEAVYKKSNALNKNSAKKLAKRLVNEAHNKSRSHTCNTPFGEKFNNSNLKRDGEILKWKGGKPDDICAVIGFVQCSNSFDI